MVLRFVPALMTKHLSALKAICHLLSHFVTCQDLPEVYWYLILYLPPYTINNRLQRAVDEVPHKRLLNKLNYYGIRSNTLQ
jgi:hypothetical protein